MLPEIPGTVFGLHPLAEVLLHVLLLERLSVVVRGEEALPSVFPWVILKERPLRVAGKAVVLPEFHGGLEANDGQTTRLFPSLVPPRQVRLPTSVVLDDMEEFKETRRLDLLLRRLLPWQIRRRLRSLGPEPIVRAPLVELYVRGSVRPSATALLPGPLLAPIILRFFFTRLLLARERQQLFIQMDVLHSARDEKLGNAVRMVRDFRLAHFLPDFRHECFVELATEFGVLPIFALLFPAVLVLQHQVVDDVVQRTPGTEVFVMLRAIFAAIHLRLSLRGYGLGVGVALVAEADRGDVAVHDLAVPTQVAPPEVGSERILRNGLVVRSAHHVLRVAVAAVPHVARAFEKPRARLGRIRRAKRIRVVEVVHVL